MQSNLGQDIRELKNQNSWLKSSLEIANNDNQKLHVFNKELITSNKSLQTELENLKKNMSLLQRYVYGQRSEKTKFIDNNQQELLFNEAEVNVSSNESPPDVLNSEDTNNLATEDESDILSQEKRGRKSLPKSLPREKVFLELSKADLSCACGGKLEHIGDEISEELHHRPASYVVREYVRYKYACKCCEEKVVRSPAAFRPLHKCVASSGMLADVIVKKYCDHLPLYRQSQILGRQGLDISRSTLSNWIIKSSLLLEPLLDIYKEELLQCNYICSDETILNVLGVNKSNCYMWVHQSGLRTERIVIYDYHSSRSKSVANNFLNGFTGYHQCDGYIGYSDIHSQEGVHGVGCWAHARRKFVEITHNVKTRGSAHELLDLINQLYVVEKRLSGLSANEIKLRRQERSSPILEKLYKQLKYHEDKVYPEGYIAKAIGYCLNQWDKLILTCPHLLPHVEVHSFHHKFLCVALQLKL